MPKITVDGLSCQHCVDAVIKALNGIEGVRDVTVNLERGYVIYSESRPVDPERVKEVITRAGFRPR